VVGFHPITGKTLWKRVLGSPSNGIVLSSLQCGFSSVRCYVTALDMSGVSNTSAVALSDDVDFNNYPSIMFALELDSGKTRWRNEISGTMSPASIDFQGNAWVVTSDGLVGYDNSTGAVIAQGAMYGYNYPDAPLADRGDDDVFTVGDDQGEKFSLVKWDLPSAPSPAP
jgi:hypothetical protein